MNNSRYSPLYYALAALVAVAGLAAVVWAAPAVTGEPDRGAGIAPAAIENQALSAQFLADSQPLPAEEAAVAQEPAQEETAQAGGAEDTPVTAALPPGATNYFWNYYDSLSMNSWIMLANEAGASGNLTYSLSIADLPMTLGSPWGAPGEVPPAKTLSYINPGMVGGPAIASALNGNKGVVSQRSLMGDSFEEVLGTDMAKSNRHFYWSWYDMQSPGFSNWIVVNNPDPVNAVVYEVRIGGAEVDAGTIPAGGLITPTYPGIMGGPVEVITDGDVLASQRVLSDFGKAFNEVPGIPATELSNDYLWTWYDMVTPGYQNWVVLANPHLSNAVDYEIKIANNTVQTGSLPAKGVVTHAFPATMDGPVEVISTGTGAGSGDIVASQRILNGKSLEDVPGLARNDLSDEYHWTWYDMTGGFVNWVVVANPDPVNTVNYEIMFEGEVVALGEILGGGRVTPTFPGQMAGPVEVTSTGGPVLASQRVTRDGYFNEVLGMILNIPDNPPAPVEGACSRVR